MHQNAIECTGCKKILEQVHPTLISWVNDLRKLCIYAHVSCGYRGKEDQEAAFMKGMSKAHFGQSPHNLEPAQAVDLFCLDRLNRARFDAHWYETIIAPEARKAGLQWGGDWPTFKDRPHVEMPGWKSSNQ